MAKWKKPVVTEYGEKLLAESINGDCTIEFVKVSIGCGIYAEEITEESLKQQTDMQQSKNEYGISSVQRKENVVTLNVLMNNASVKEGYDITELGLWAKRQGSESEPQLYSLVIADIPDYFPDSSTPTTVNQAFQMVFASSDTKVEITQDMGAYVLLDDFEESIENLDKNKVNENDMQKAIQAVYENANQFTLAKIAELINGAPTTADTLKEIADLIADNKSVVDALDAAVGKKANQSELDTHISNNTIHFTASERTKLAGIATAANKYIHPVSAAGAKASGLYKIVTDATGHVTGTAAVTKADITGLGIPGANTTYSTGTASVAGLTKLYTSVGTGTDGTMTRSAITSALNGKATSGHTHRGYFTTITGTSSNSVFTFMKDNITTSTSASLFILIVIKYGAHILLGAMTYTGGYHFHVIYKDSNYINAELNASKNITVSGPAGTYTFFSIVLSS